jgi:hypothetical protein
MVLCNVIAGTILTHCICAVFVASQIHVRITSLHCAVYFQVIYCCLNCLCQNRIFFLNINININKIFSDKKKIRFYFLCTCCYQQAMSISTQKKSTKTHQKYQFSNQKLAKKTPNCHVFPIVQASATLPQLSHV